MARENAKDNDLFYTCALIDYIARKTKNTRSDVVNKLGKERLEKIYDLADVYHCDNLDRVSDDFIEDPTEDEALFVENLRTETEQNVQRLVSHPSIVWWNGDNVTSHEISVPNFLTCLIFLLFCTIMYRKRLAMMCKVADTPG